MENFSGNDTQFNDFNTEYENSFESDHSDNSQNTVPNTFALFSRSLGIFSILCALFSMFLGTFLCGGLAVILAILSKGYETRMERNARIGVVTGIISMVLQISVFAVNIYSIIYIPETREQFFTIYEEMYGVPVEESIEDLLEDIGFSTSEGGNL